MFASRAATNAHGGHRFAPSAKFTPTRQISHEVSEDQRVAEIEEEPHPTRAFLCALVSSLFCPIFGILGLFYATRAIRAYRRGFYAQATTLHKQSIRWSLINFIFGLTIGSVLAFLFFLKVLLFF